MGAGGVTELMKDPAGGPPGLIQAWLRALRRVGSVPLTESHLRELIAELAGRLRAALVADPFDPAAGRAVGAELVEAGFGAPEALSRTITVMYAELVHPAPAADRAQVSARLVDLLGSLASGFTEAVHHRTLEAQESVRDAAMRAVVEAERRERDAQAKLQHLATHDPVTGLPNRAVLMRRLTELVRAASPGDRLGLCCVDLDRFATVSDSLGHEMACKLLQTVATRLEQLAASTGWFLSHLETDQFAILVEHTTCSEDATKVADRVLTVLSDPFRLCELELPMTASAGVVERPATVDPTGWLQAAQTALHWAQADGHGRWRLFDHDRSRLDVARYRMLAALPRALRRNEITSFYQPLVDLATGQVVGYEALARWHHPEEGLLTAGRFIDLAERTGVLVPLSYQLLNQACQEAAAWPPNIDQAPYLSVNLAAGQLRQPSLVGHIAQILDHTGLPPQRLQLEITEQTIVDPGGVDTADTAATLRALDQLGVRLAVDDFGTGYSNLTRLRDLPVSTVKLDASLAKPQQPAIQTRHDEFLAAVVALARTLGMTVTAEGIETDEHARRMRAAGCDTGQGWLLGEPMPSHHIRTRTG
jgi:diguanylate cyclase (GGDEF)-like protein